MIGQRRGSGGVPRETLPGYRAGRGGLAARGGSRHTTPLGLGLDAVAGVAGTVLYRRHRDDDDE